MKVLLTGATGTLGRPLVRSLVEAGHHVRAMSRREHADREDVEWVRGDLKTGERIAESVTGMDAVIHAATLSGVEDGKTKLRYLFFHPAHTDVGGTRRLVAAAHGADVSHLVFTSIVGVDKIPMSYQKHKVEAEEIVVGGGLPYTIARASQFFELIDATIRNALRYPIAVMPRVQRVQPIDPTDAARAIVPLLDRGPAGGIVNFGGPEELTLGEAADTWLEHRGVRRRIRGMPLPSRIGKALASGALCTEDHSGTITWREWLEAHPVEGS